MSLILEALKKLERERESTGRGFLVVAHTPWAVTRGRPARVILAALACGAVAGAAAWGAWTWLASRDTAPAAARAGSVAVPRGPASPLPPPIWETASTAPAASDASAIARPRGAPIAAPASAPATAAPVEPEEPPLLVIAPRVAPPAAPLHLEAISSQDGEPVAVINGQLVRKGQRIEGALVTWIGADAVEIEVDGRRRVLGF